MRKSSLITYVVAEIQTIQVAHAWNLLVAGKSTTGINAAMMTSGLDASDRTDQVASLGIANQDFLNNKKLRKED